MDRYARNYLKGKMKRMNEEATLQYQYIEKAKLIIAQKTQEKGA